MSDSAPQGRRARPSGREARRAQRALPPVAPAYITRQTPPYELLSEEGLQAVERHADLLLEEIGLEIRGDTQALGLWQKAGARIDGVRVHQAPPLDPAADEALREYVERRKRELPDEIG